MVVQNLTPNIQIVMQQTARHHLGCQDGAVNISGRVVDIL